jgi:hypothetical protein
LSFKDRGRTPLAKKYGGPLEPGNSSKLAASKKTGTQILQLQGTGFTKNLHDQEMASAQQFQDKHTTADTSISAQGHP